MQTRDLISRILGPSSFPFKQIEMQNKEKDKKEDKEEERKLKDIPKLIHLFRMMAPKYCFQHTIFEPL